MSLRPEVGPPRWVRLKVAWRVCQAMVLSTAALVAAHRWAEAVADARAAALVRTRWYAEPTLCENSQGTWQRCPWVKR